MDTAFLVGAGSAGLVAAIAAMILSAPRIAFLSNVCGGLVGAALAAFAFRELGVGYHSFGDSLAQVASVSAIGALAMLCVVAPVRSSIQRPWARVLEDRAMQRSARLAAAGVRARRRATRQPQMRHI